ncbi:hypothetical protein AgCh_023427 [Apium graveolens]
MLPPTRSADGKKSSGYVNLVEEFGELSLIRLDIAEDIICELWILEKEGETNQVWTKMITVNLSNSVGEDWLPIGFNNNLELVLINYDFDTSGFCTYDPEMEVTEMDDDSSDLCSDVQFDDPNLWSYAEFDDPQNPKHSFGRITAFDYSPQQMQPMYVNSFEETLVLLGEEDEVELEDD